jgi:two-component system, response regulator
VNRSRVILLVEDDANDVDLTLRAFARCPAPSQISVVRSGEEALQYLFREGPYHSRDRTLDPQIVLLDLNLPRMDGIAVLRQLRADARTRRLPVVILTSSNVEEDIARSYDSGANSFVRKPVDFTAFLTAANQLGVYWLDLNEISSDGLSRRIP